MVHCFKKFHLFLITFDFVFQVAQSDDHRVVLRNVTQDLDGRYRCEVSNDLPDFSTVLVSNHMHVASKYYYYYYYYYFTLSNVFSEIFKFA